MAGKVKPATLGIGIVCATVLIIIAVVAVVRQSQPRETLSPQAAAGKTWLDAKARESGGDINRLSPEDQQKIRAKIGPQAEWLLQSRAQELATGARR